MMESDIGSLLHKVSTLLDKTSDQVLMERLGIGLSQFRIIFYLLNSDGVRQKIIAQQLAQSEPSVSRQVSLLQKKGMIVVRRNVASRRDRLIFLTHKGAQTAEKSVNVLNDYHLPMFEALSRKQQEQLVATLRTMQDYIK